MILHCKNILLTLMCHFECRTYSMLVMEFFYMALLLLYINIRNLSTSSTTVDLVIKGLFNQRSSLRIWQRDVRTEHSAYSTVHSNYVSFNILTHT